MIVDDESDLDFGDVNSDSISDGGFSTDSNGTLDGVVGRSASSIQNNAYMVDGPVNFQESGWSAVSKVVRNDSLTGRSSIVS